MEIAFRTDIGKKRKSNQDYVAVFYNQAKVPLVLLADGMGGHNAGDIASQLTVEDLGGIWEKTEMADPEEILLWLIKEIREENQLIFEKGRQDDQLFGMGTTIVAVVLFEKSFLLAHIGDSRCYLLRDNTIKQLTEDHSLVNELLKRGEITEEMADHHPRKNVLIRSVGMPGNLDVDVSSHQSVEDDYLLLCSDGLTNMVSDERIKEIMVSQQSVEEKIDLLVNEANEAGGQDNITVLVVHYDREDT